MKVHEYQAKELLKAAGVAVPAGIVAQTAEEAADAFDRLACPLVVVKAQVHAGGRGKGIAIGPDADRAEALAIASGQKPRPEGVARGVQLVKSQGRGPQGGREPPGQDPRHLPDRAPRGRRSPRSWSRPATTSPASCTSAWPSTARSNARCVMATTEGGVDIEIVAHEHPEKIHREPIDVGVGLADFQARKLAQVLGLKGESAKKGEAFFKAFVRMFLDKDASLAEINPLIVTEAGDVLALDCKLNFDDNALFKHRDVAAVPRPRRGRPQRTPRRP